MTAAREQGRFVPGQSYNPATEFKPGERPSPATEFKPGEHRGPATEFKAGQAAHNRLPLGAVTIRTRFGVRRAYVKIAEPNVWQRRAMVVWERANGTRVPRGHVVHHIDRDSLNDDLSNLVLLSRSQHIAEHRDEIEIARWRTA